MKFNQYLTLGALATLLAACSSNDSTDSASKKTSSRSDIFRVVQIGDSHTAGDYFTDELRRILQGKLSNGGIGLVAPNKVSGQRTATVEYNGYGWETLSSRRDYGDFPLGGIIARTSGGSQTISPRGFVGKKQNVTFTLKPLSNNATLNVTANGKTQKISGLKAGQWQYKSIEANLPITISSSAGSSWDLGQISLENAEGGGATVSALGINGAKLTQTQKWRKAWLDDLKASQANVVILAYGTNEAFNDDLDIAETEQYWTSVIRQIKKTLPKAKIVVLGAPESLKSTAGSCGTRPVMLDAVQQMQQRIAKAEKTLFWSWEKAMGGRCTMKSWIAQGLAARDGVHFSATGYETVARQFANDILKLVR